MQNLVAVYGLLTNVATVLFISLKFCRYFLLTCRYIVIHKIAKVIL